MVCLNKGWFITITRPGMEDREIRPGIHPLDRKALQAWCDEHNSAEHRQHDGRVANVTPYK